MPRQTNNKIQSTSQAQEDIPASTPKTEECLLSIKNKNLIEDQQKVIDKLIKRISTLEGNFYKLEGRLLITQAVNHHLELMIDSQDQYFRRQWLVINGMTEPENESDNEKLVLSRMKEETWIDEDVIQQNIDKIHQFKPVSIRFNLQPSLTKRRLELLKYPKEKLKAVKEIKFPYAIEL